MKKIFLYLAVLLILIYLFPVILTSRFNSKDIVAQSINEEQKVEVDKSQYNYSKYGNIQVLNSKTNEVKEMNLDEYLLGVVSAEMPADFHIEALKAQAVVARTYTIYTITNNSAKHGEGIICTESTCCQAWLSKEERLEKWEEAKREENWQKIEEAVYSTKGKIIEYNGEPIDAFFHSNSGGITEVPVNVWGGTDFPYLQSVETAGEEDYSQYNSEVTVSKSDLENKMKDTYPDFSINWQEAECIKITERTNGQRARFVKIGNKNISGVQVRSIFGLRSANFEIEVSGNNVRFFVKGYGHGVGMSQTGADSMAKAGANYEEIIKHFYTGVEIISM